MKIHGWVFTLIILSVSASAQTYNSNAGGWNTGYGTVYGSFGYAMATQNLYNSVQMQIQRLTMRQAMIKQFGLAAVEKSEREAKQGKTTSNTTSASAGPIVQAPPVPKYYGRFRPDATVNTGKILADALGETPEEKQLYTQIYSATKTAFEKEAAARGWKNNVAGALTFFMVSNATVYHDSAEPNDETVTALYEAINQAIDEIPEFAKMPNRDKQAFYNILIAFTGIPLATYSEGKESGNTDTVNAARQLAGEMIKMILKTDPASVRFENGGLVVGK
jgi:hypothetical protein